MPTTRHWDSDEVMAEFNATTAAVATGCSTAGFETSTDYILLGSSMLHVESGTSGESIFYSDGLGGNVQTAKMYDVVTSEPKYIPCGFMFSDGDDAYDTMQLYVDET